MRTALPHSLTDLQRLDGVRIDLHAVVSSFSAWAGQEGHVFEEVPFQELGKDGDRC